MKMTGLIRRLTSRMCLVTIFLSLYFMASAQSVYSQATYEVVTELRDGIFEVGECTQDPYYGFWSVGVTLKLDWDPVPGADRYYICNNGIEVTGEWPWTETYWVIASVYGSGLAPFDPAWSCEEAIANMKAKCLEDYINDYLPYWSVKAVFDLGTPNPGCDSDYVIPYWCEDCPGKETHDNVNVSEPVDVITGEVSIEEEDITIPTCGLPLSFSRSYRSHATDSGCLGPGWRHNYDMELKEYIIYSSQSEELGRYAELRDSEGNHHRYQYIDGEYRCCSYTLRTHPFLVEDDLILSDWHGTKYYFDSISGKLIKIEDRNGNSLTLNYSDQKLSSVTHSNGLALNLIYEGDQLVRLETPSEVAIEYVYDSEGLLIAAIKSSPEEDIITLYGYQGGSTEPYKLLTEKIDPSGNVLSWSYDLTETPPPCLSFEGDDGDFETVFTYHSNGGNQTMVEYNRGEDGWQWYLYNYDPDRHHIYSIEGPITDTEDSGITTRFTYNDYENITAKTIAHPDDPSYYLKTSMTYNENNNITSFITGKVVNLWSYPAGTRTYLTYNSTYNFVESITDPSGRVMEFNYYPATGDLEKISMLDGQGGSVDYNFTEYNPRGQIVSATDPNNNTTTFAYDTYGYLDTVDLPLLPLIDFNYNEMGQLESVILPGDRAIEYDVDDLGRVKSITFPPAEPGSQPLVASFDYDENGNLTGFTDTSGKTTTYGYETFSDLLTSITKILDDDTGPRPITISASYNKWGNLKTVEDALQRVVAEYDYGALDSPTEVINLENQDQPISYYPDGSIKDITTVGGTAINFDYNARNRLETITYPDDTVNLTYLENGLIDTVSDSSGTVDFDTNDLNRLTSADGVLANDTVSYTYYPGGQRQTMTSPSLTTSYGIDALNRLETITNEYGETTTITYDPVTGTPATMTYSNGVSCTYSFDDLDRLTSMVWKDASLEVIRSYEYKYNDAGMRKKAIHEDGTYIEYGYDSLDRLISERLYSSSEALLTESIFDYDDTGNKILKERDGATVTYINTLNKLGQLTVSGDEIDVKVPVMGSADEPMGTGDVNGVPVDISGDDFSIQCLPLLPGPNTITASIRDVAGNLATTSVDVNITVVDSASYLYDLEGNLEQKTEGSNVWNYIWDKRNRLTEVKLNGETEFKYYYDALGRRIKAEEYDGGSLSDTTLFVYDGFECIMEQDGTGTPLCTYTYGPGIDNILSIRRGGASYYYIKDGLGSVTALVDSSGDIVESYSYDAYGRPRIFDSNGVPIAESQLGNPYLFTGRRYNPDTGLYFYRFRYYDPVVGRFISKDPIGLLGGLNLYTYVTNNPVNFVDPYGLLLDPFTWGVIIGGTIAAMDIGTYAASKYFWTRWYGVDYAANDVYAQKATWGIILAVAPVPKSGAIFRWFGSRGGTYIYKAAPYAMINWITTGYGYTLGKGWDVVVKRWNYVQSYGGGGKKCQDSKGYDDYVNDFLLNQAY